MEIEKVSCLMVTLNRFEHVRRSVSSFCQQDYPNKELVILTCGGSNYAERLGALVRSIGRTDIRCVSLGAAVTLGALRNASVEHALGPMVCQWDDDDLSHPKRLSMQVEAMRADRARVSFLVDAFHFFGDSRSLYWCDWSRSRATIALPGTLLASRMLFPATMSV